MRSPGENTQLKLESNAEVNAEALLKAVNEGAASARTLFITLMVLALYIFIVVSGTDDEMLLRDSTIAVPTLSNATVPASAFYALAPWLFLFLHLDLLIHFQLLAGKLRRFNEELSRLPAGDGRDDFRVRLASFPFANWLGSDPRRSRLLFVLQALIVWLTLVLLPIAVLLYLQLGFLPYHSELITWAHRLAVLADVTLLLYFWPQMAAARWRDPAARETRSHVLWQALRAKLPTCFQSQKLRKFVAGLAIPSGYLAPCFWILLAGLPALFLAWLVATIPDSGYEHWFSASFVRIDKKTLDQLIQIEEDSEPKAEIATAKTCMEWVSLSPWVPAMVREGSSGTVETPEERYWREANRLSEGIAATCLQIALFHLKGSPFHRNLSVRDRVLAKSEVKPELAVNIRSSLRDETSEGGGRKSGKDALKEHQDAIFQLQPLDLSDRDLRYADFSGSSFPGARFFNTLLDRAILAKADLRRVDLVNGIANHADFSRATLTGAKLNSAKLTRAYLTGATLTGANLGYATLNGAHLSGATLTGATLTGADLTGATLTGADLTGATLTGAYLTGATLTGAGLFGTTLTGANLSDATLTGAILSETILRATHFPKSSSRQTAMLVFGVSDGRLTPEDLADAERALDEAGLPEKRRKWVSTRLRALFDTQTGTTNFAPSDCVGSAPRCSADLTDIARNADAHIHQLASLVCPEEASPFNKDLASRLLEVLQMEATIEAIMAPSPDPLPPYWKPLATAAEAALRALATGPCADRLKDMIPKEFRPPPSVKGAPK